MSKIKTSKKQGSKAVIVQHAAALFRQRGYMVSTMRQLATSMHVEAPSLYNHIKNKADLLQIICTGVAESFALQQAAVQAEQISAAKKIEKIIRFHIKMMLTSFDLLFVANHDWRYLPVAEKAVFLQQRKNYEQGIVNLVKVGIRNDELRQQQPQVATLTILAALRGLEFWQQYNKLNNLKALENNIVTQLLEGIIK